jgi:UDP-N-acetylmuramyl pentapeptide phosphotransferase/UDP-N-acetylglucosamine-1-phosphate transferase
MTSHPWSADKLIFFKFVLPFILGGLGILIAIVVAYVIWHRSTTPTYRPPSSHMSSIAILIAILLGLVILVGVAQLFANSGG